MAWLGEGLSSLRGQITSFTKEVLSEGREEDRSQEVKLQDAEEKIQELESLCAEKNSEISRLRELNASLEIKASQLPVEHKTSQQPILFNVGSSSSLGDLHHVYSFEDLGNAKREVDYDFSSMETEKDDLVDYLRAEIRALKIEKEKAEKKLQTFQKSCHCLETRPVAGKDELKASENATNKEQQTGSLSTSESRLQTSQPATFSIGKEPTGENWKIEDARGECDGSEEVPKEMVRLMDQISKLSISLSDAQLTVEQFQENEKKLLSEIERLKIKEFQVEEKVRDVKLQLKVAEETNNLLEQKLEDLDNQHAQAIGQLITVKASLQQKNDELQLDVENLKQHISNLENELESYSAKFQLLNSDKSSLRREIELEMEKQILKFIPPDLIPREQTDIKELSVVVGAVKSLAKLSEEHRWKKDAIEKKMAEMMKETREAKAQCLQLRSEIAHRENSSGLRNEGLEPILETGEEEEEEEEAAVASRKDSSQNAGTRALLESKLTVENEDRIYLMKRCHALEEEIKRLRAQECRESDLYDDEDEDDVDGTEEANDWIWQGSVVTKDKESANENEFSKQSLSIYKGTGDSTTSQDSEGEGTISVLPSYSSEKKVDPEKSIEFQEKKKIIPCAKEKASRNLVTLECEVDSLNKNLEAKTKHIVLLEGEVKELREKVLAFESEKNHLREQLTEKETRIEDLGSTLFSLNSEIENEKKKSDEMRKTIFDLNRQISQHEFILKDKEELLNKQLENVKILEDQNIFFQHSLKQKEDLDEEKCKCIGQLEEKVEELQKGIYKEAELKEEALKQAQEAHSKCHDLDTKLNYEIQLKEEALNKLTDVEERLKIVEKSVNDEMKSKNEFTDNLLELEKRMVAVQEKATLDQKVIDEAILRVNELEHMKITMESELTMVKQKLMEKEKLLEGQQNKLTALEMERERIMCVVGDKAREISSLRSERQRLMEAMSLMEKTRQREIVGGDAPHLLSASTEIQKTKDSSSETLTEEKDELDDEGTLQLLAKLKSLQLESEQLAESYRQEQQRSKHLQNEVHELMEKEASLQDELNRLRQHLVSVEDRYTKEAVSAQDHITFLKSKLTQVEERLHASSSAYTSASVRCNQQVECLENQVKALTEKRDESKSRLMIAEEQLAQQAKDLANLQSVLEQFQRDKEREISMVKDKMGMQISSLENKNEELSLEISNLKDQLQQAKEGLSAAARLSEQVDKKSEIIASLKTELKKLNTSVISAEEKLQSASLSVEGKVDKNLVKNLLLGYLSAPAQGSRRGEILRIIATVLEFSKEDKEKVDLGEGSGKSFGWLRGIPGWSGQHKEGVHSGDLNQPSLSEAFIRFLENESRPKSQIRMLSDTRVESNASSSQASVQTNSPISSSTPPLLMSESILPTLSTFSVTSGSSSSCILKDVLKDS